MFHIHEGSLDYTVTTVSIPQTFVGTIQSVRHVIGSEATRVNSPWSPIHENYLLVGETGSKQMSKYRLQINAQEEVNRAF